MYKTQQQNHKRETKNDIHMRNIFVKILLGYLPLAVNFFLSFSSLQHNVILRQ